MPPTREQHDPDEAPWTHHRTRPAKMGTTRPPPMPMPSQPKPAVPRRHVYCWPPTEPFSFAPAPPKKAVRPRINPWTPTVPAPNDVRTTEMPRTTPKPEPPRRRPRIVILDDVVIRPAVTTTDDLEGPVDADVLDIATSPFRMDLEEVTFPPIRPQAATPPAWTAPVVIDLTSPATTRPAGPPAPSIRDPRRAARAQPAPTPIEPPAEAALEDPWINCVDELWGILTGLSPSPPHPAASSASVVMETAPPAPPAAEPAITPVTAPAVATTVPAAPATPVTPDNSRATTTAPSNPDQLTRLQDMPRDYKYSFEELQSLRPFWVRSDRRARVRLPNGRQVTIPRAPHTKRGY